MVDSSVLAFYFYTVSPDFGHMVLFFVEGVVISSFAPFTSPTKASVSPRVDVVHNFASVDRNELISHQRSREHFLKGHVSIAILP